MGIYYCNMCDFHTKILSFHKQHLKTIKHRKNEIKRDMILQNKIAKRMAYEELVKNIPGLETRESLLKKDDRHVEQVLKQFGIKIDFGKTIIV